MRMRSILLVFLLASLLLGCSTGTPTATAPTPDFNATASAVIAATSTAQAELQATVDAAVKLTAAAVPTQTPAASPTPAAQVNYYTLSEEELAALINESATEAATASDTAYTTTTQATSDGTVTAEEIQEIEDLINDADALLTEVDALITAYDDLYGEIAAETLDLLNAVEQELATITTDLTTISGIIAQGADQATAAIEKLNAAAQEAHTQAAQAEQQIKTLSTTLANEINQREQAILAIQPNNIPKTPAAALESASQFIQAYKTALGDKKLSLDELKNIGQLAANASAGLKQFGGPKLSGFSTNINQLTQQLARGQLPQASQGFGEFESLLPKRP